MGRSLLAVSYSCGNSFESNGGLVVRPKSNTQIIEKENHDPVSPPDSLVGSKSDLTQEHSTQPSPTNSNEVTISVRQRGFEDHINTLSTQERNTEFRAALFGGRVDLIHRFLVMPNSNTIGPNGYVADGYTPLQWTAEHCMVDMTYLLLQRGANPSCRDGLFSSPLQLVLDEAQFEVEGDRASVIAKRLIQYLVRREIDTNGRMPFGSYDMNLLKRENGPFLQYYWACVQEYQQRG